MDAVVAAGGDVLEPRDLGSSLHILATVSAKVLSSDLSIARELLLLPKELVSISVVELYARVGGNEDFLQPLGLVAKSIEVIFLDGKESSV